MMQKLWIGVVALTGTVLLAGGTTSAVETPEALKCSSKKLKTVGKDWQSKLKCYSKAIKEGVAVDPECLGKATTKITDKFTSIEGDGGCATDANLFDLNADGNPDGTLANILNQTDNGYAFGGTTLIYRGINGPVISSVNRGLYAEAAPTPLSASKCTQKKLAALGKFAAALFKCESKEAKKNLPDNPECTDKAVEKYNKKIVKAEEEPDCQVTDDGEFLSGEAFRTIQRIIPNMPRFDGCGNNLTTTGESCDDGNTAHFDACPSDCTIDPCTPTANPRPVTVHTNDATLASVSIELDYPEGKVSLPGTGFEGDVTNLTGSGSFDALDFEHAIRIVASDAAAFGTMDIAQLNFVDCSVGGPPVVGDFTCTVTSATGPGGTPDKTATTTCTVTIP